jgi:signal-transduction protein with cAMP-binding, CBS, and nucleotidyltransferase domain
MIQLKTAIIRHRVADFLKQHAPFDSLPESDLLALAGSGRVKFHEDDEFLFRQGDAPGTALFVIQQGRVELLDETAAIPRLRDVLGEGDLLGLDRLLGYGKHRHSARTVGDVILYAIDATLFAGLAAAHREVERYVAAHAAVGKSGDAERSSWLAAEPPPAAYLRARRDAVGAVEAPMIEPPLTTRAAVRRMITTGSNAIATPSGGLFTGEDLAIFCGWNPAGLLERIRSAGSPAELGPLLGRARRMIQDALAGPADIDDGTLLGGACIRAALDAAVRIAERELGAAGFDRPRPAFCWLAFGPAARDELLVPSLPSLAVVHDGEATPETASWFAALAGQTIACLNECGLEGPGLFWPDGAQPCMPLAEWTRFYSETVRDPIGSGIYRRREFFDVAPMSGDPAVATALAAHLSSELASGERAVWTMANDTLSNLPPLTLFRGLVVQLDGAQADQLDLRKTLLHPIADAARAFALGLGGQHPSTVQRLASAARQHPARSALFEEAAAAFRAALYFEALAGNSAIDPSLLGRYDQRVLKTAFASVQRLLEFTTTAFTL